MSLAIRDFYRFGDFTVDGEQKVLLQKNSPVPLAPKVFDTLLILIGSSGRIVEKEELMSRLWPNTFVEESNLTFNIQQLRKALGDNARQPRFVETVARRGYRFIAEIQENPPNETKGTQSLPAIAEERPLPQKASYFTVAAFSFLLVGLVAGIVWFTQRQRSVFANSATILSKPFKSEKFVTGGVVRAVITPDGKYVAFTSDNGGKQTIWLRQLETSENIQIVPPSDYTYLGLAVSHDGNSLFFVRKSLSNPPLSELYRVMTFGGIPTKIIDRTEGTVSASPDDRQICFTRCNYKDDDFCSLNLVDVDGTNERSLFTTKRPTRLAGVQFSPDGKSLAFASGESSNGATDFHLMLLDLSTGSVRQLTNKNFFDITNLKWLPDRTGLLIAAKENYEARIRIWLVSSDTGEAKPVTRDATDYVNLSLDTAADKMIATHTSNTFHLFVSSVNDIANPKTLSIARTGLAFAPDGRIVYEGDDGDIWAINRNGGEQRQLTNNSFSDLFPCASPDNRYLYFSSNRSGSSQVWRMNVDGTNQLQVTKREGGAPKFATSDGRWIYFESTLHQTLWRVASDGSEESEVSSNKLNSPAFSPDGQKVAYFFRDQHNNRLKIGVMLMANKTLLKIFDLGENASERGKISWQQDGNSFYYVAMNGPENLLWHQSLGENQQPQMIANLGSEDISDFALAPDGNTFAFIRGKWIYEAVLIEGLQ
jgi:DNA-binding winged helix-turn-helix (wHTH) protein/Tol biopolymer transport system component